MFRLTLFLSISLSFFLCTRNTLNHAYFGLIYKHQEYELPWHCDGFLLNRHIDNLIKSPKFDLLTNDEKKKRVKRMFECERERSEMENGQILSVHLAEWTPRTSGTRYNTKLNQITRFFNEEATVKWNLAGFVQFFGYLFWTSEQSEHCV